MTLIIYTVASVLNILPSRVCL